MYIVRTLADHCVIKIEGTNVRHMYSAGNQVEHKRKCKFHGESRDVTNIGYYHLHFVQYMYVSAFSCCCDYLCGKWHDKCNTSTF
jgi:hypothetical protein